MNFDVYNGGIDVVPLWDQVTIFSPLSVAAPTGVYGQPGMVSSGRLHHAGYQPDMTQAWWMSVTIQSQVTQSDIATWSATMRTAAGATIRLSFGTQNYTHNPIFRVDDTAGVVIDETTLMDYAGTQIGLRLDSDGTNITVSVGGVEIASGALNAAPDAGGAILELSRSFAPDPEESPLAALELSGYPSATPSAY